MRVKTKLLPNSTFGWFGLGICITGVSFRFGREIPGFYLYLFCFSILSVSILFIFPPFFPKKWETNLQSFMIATLVFVLFANTNHVSEKRQTRTWFRSLLVDTCKHSHLSPLEQRIVIGLVTGSTSEIPRDFKEIAKESGILHLFAASGLHLGIFIGSLQFLGNLIFSKQRWISILLSLGFGWYYLYLLNFPVSFVRAYSFAFFTLVSSLLYRKIAVSDLLIISSAAITFFLFSDFLSIGFLLSFGAVFGIFYLKPSLDQMIFPHSKSLLKENLTLTLVCSLCSFPILVTYFHSFSYGGIWINYLLVPLAGILLPCIYITLFLQTILPVRLEVVLSDWIWTPVAYLLSLFLRIFQFLSESGRGYRIWEKESYLLVWFSLFLILILWFIYRWDFHKIKFFRWILPSLLVSFFPLGYFFPKKESLPVIFQKGKGYFTIAIEDRLFLYGTCSPYKRFELPNTNKEIQTILFESESCLQTVLRLKKKQNLPNIVWFDQNNSPFQKSMFMDGIQIQTSERLGQEIKKEFSLFRFDGNPKGIPSLLRSLKETEQKKIRETWKGFLILDFPLWKKKEAKEWIAYQKLLGISNAWKILIVEDQFEIPLLHDLTNPNLL
ncbi:ComEC/Rec2 family competence protein [Leptospira kemamanensis]|uniref:ComEC/Rec2 family competence protein n=1 Tax=Leptospira kemamanensis TaxID=2484942 RepID=A0A4R9JQ70_9LEPT|nr:ComEC/Rec2 family competence protein [Leptospira kemamanensis]